jgi:hypothetical protein
MGSPTPIFFVSFSSAMFVCFMRYQSNLSA